MLHQSQQHKSTSNGTSEQQMMSELDREKTQQVLSYLRWRAGRELSLKEIFALVYLADRYHLRKHGMTIIRGHSIPGPEGYIAVDPSLPPINLDVAHCLGLHPEDRERFLIELDLA